MMFNYAEFIDELKNSQKSSDQSVYSNWLEIKGSTNIKEEQYYKYLKKIKPIKYRVPTDLKKDFDWELLLRLVAISLASSYEFVFPDPDETDSEEDIDMTLPDLVIHVKSGENQVAKKISELWSFQILRLYEIYCSENINYIHIYKESGEGESHIVDEYLENIANYKTKAESVANYAKRLKCFV